MVGYHVSKPGLDSGIVLQSDFHRQKLKVSVFFRACVQGPEVFAATLIATGYTDTMLGSTGATKWATEGLVEWVRTFAFPDRPARHDSVYLFESVDLARRFIADFRKDSQSVIYRCRVESATAICTADMDEFTRIHSILNQASVHGSLVNYYPLVTTMAQRYWAPVDRPGFPELLVKGGRVTVEGPEAVSGST